MAEGTIEQRVEEAIPHEVRHEVLQRIREGNWHILTEASLLIAAQEGLDWSQVMGALPRVAHKAFPEPIVPQDDE